MGISGLVLLGVAIAAGLWVIRRFLPMIVSFRQGLRMFRLWFFRIAALIWTIYLLITLYFLLKWAPLFTALLIVIVLLPFWPFWKDFVPGLLFRLEGLAVKGDLLVYRNETCSFESMGYRFIRLKTAEGNILLLPYHRIQEIEFSQTARVGITNDHSFLIHCRNLDRDTVVTALNRLILESPWSLPSGTARIQVLDDGIFRVTLAAIDAQIADRLRRNLQHAVDLLCRDEQN